MDKQLKDMTDIEIKAIITDERDRIDIASQNVQILRSELARRANAAVAQNGTQPVLAEAASE